MECHAAGVESVQHFETHADLSADDGVPDDRHMAVDLVMEAVLNGGRHVTVLADRGWGASGPSGVWSYESAESVITTARMCVGPDEPAEGESHAQAEADYWASVVHLLSERGISATADDLAHLPHHVVLSDRVQTRLAKGESAGGAIGKRICG